MILPIQILSNLISSTAHTLQISNVVDNGNGTFTLYVNFTYYLNSQRTVTIDAVDYRITDFVLNESITVSGTIIPTATEFNIDPPEFRHGTPKKVNGEMVNQNTKSYPLIWLLEFLEIDYNDNFTDSTTATPDLNLFFLTDVYQSNWDIDQHYTEAIHPMLNEIDFFIRTLKKRRDLFGELESHKVTNHVNFGEYITNKGYDKKILSDNLSGCQLKISLPYVVDVCLGDVPIVSICNPATEIIKDTDGAVLYTDKITSGALNNRIIQDSTNTFNGGAISGGLAEGTKAIVVQTDAAIPVGTAIVDTKDQLTIEVSTGSTPLPYRAFSGQTTSYQDYDDGYYLQAGYYGGGILSSYYNLTNSDLTPWSHLKRFAGTTGGYYDDVTLTYHDEDGTLNAGHSASFPDGLINDYLNGFQWYYLPVGSRVWGTAISEIESLTFKTFSDWAMPSKSQVQEIENNEFSNPYVNGIFNITGDFWSSTTVKANTLQAWGFNPQGEARRNNKTISKFRVLIRKF